MKIFPEVSFMLFLSWMGLKDLGHDILNNTTQGWACSVLLCVDNEL
jgi:hypothetical protein